MNRNRSKSFVWKTTWLEIRELKDRRPSRQHRALVDSEWHQLPLSANRRLEQQVRPLVVCLAAVPLLHRLAAYFLALLLLLQHLANLHRLQHLEQPQLRQQVVCSEVHLPPRRLGACLELLLPQPLANLHQLQPLAHLPRRVVSLVVLQRPHSEQHHNQLLHYLELRLLLLREVCLVR